MKDDDFKRHHDGIGMKTPLRPRENVVYVCPECDNAIAMDYRARSVEDIESVRCANCDVYMKWQ